MNKQSSGRREILLVNGERFEIEVRSLERGRVLFELNGRSYLVEREVAIPTSDPSKSDTRQSITTKNTRSNTTEKPLRDSEGNLTVRAPIPGVITEVLIDDGERVRSGQVLLKLEAMKMQNRILSPSAGTIYSILVRVGQEVGDAETLVLIKED